MSRQGAPKVHSEQRQRTAVVSFRLDANEAAKLAQKADRACLALGAYAREVLLSAKGPRARHRPSRQRYEFSHLLGQVGRIGGNCNQLAKAANTHGDLPTIEQLHEITRQLQELSREIQRALRR